MTSSVETMIGLNAMSNMFLKMAEILDKENENSSEIVYNTAIELNPSSSDALEAMAIYYELKKKDHNAAEEFYLKALELDEKNPRILYNFADFHRQKSDYEKMIYYLDLAAAEGDIDSIFELAKWFYEKGHNGNGDIEQFIKYYTMAADLLTPENVKNKYYGKKDFELKMSKFELLEILENIENPSNGIKLVISTINSNDIMLFYKNKVRLFTKLNNVHECQICLENNLNIDLPCGHEVCTDCYKKVYQDTCPFCRRMPYCFDSDEEDEEDEEVEDEEEELDVEEVHVEEREQRIYGILPDGWNHVRVQNNSSINWAEIDTVD
jgi:tetratricopeptide (TPR) repeat protein